MATKKARTSQKKIETKAQYNAAMASITNIMRKGEKNLSAKELAQLKAMAEAAENFEDFHFPLPEPSSLSEMIELRMFQMKLNKTKAAEVLGIANSKFSQIMNGKRKPDIAFLKSAHKNLKIDPKFLLEKI
jgi:HTH-type transcriptional regulator/antitoxin HigA